MNINISHSSKSYIISGIKIILLERYHANVFYSIAIINDKSSPSKIVLKGFYYISSSHIIENSCNNSWGSSSCLCFSHRPYSGSVKTFRKIKSRAEIHIIRPDTKIYPSFANILCALRICSMKKSLQ